MTKKIDSKSAVKTGTGRNRLASIVAGAAVSAVSLLGASLARASSTITITRQNGTRTTRWSITDGGGGGISLDGWLRTTTTGGSGSARYHLGRALGIYLGTPSGLSSIDREWLSGASSLTEVAFSAGATVVDNSPNGGTISGDAKATLNGADIGVDWNLEFSSSAAQVTGTFEVTNNSSSAFEGYVGVYTAFGSNNDTVVEATSSGDTTIADGDNWVITSENSGESPGDAPIIVSAIANANAVIGPYTSLNAGEGDLVWRVPVSLAPGASTTIVVGHCLYETIAEAQDDMAGGSCEDILDAGEPVPPAAAPTVPVPVMQNPALLALAILTGLLGTGSLVSRRKRSQK